MNAPRSIPSRSAMNRHTATLLAGFGLVLAAFFAVAICPVRAPAATYSVKFCTAAGEATLGTGLSIAADPPGSTGFTTQNLCGEVGEERILQEAPSNQAHAQEAGQRWTLTAPPNTLVAGLTLFQNFLFWPDPPFWPNSGFQWEIMDATGLQAEVVSPGEN